MEDVLDVYHRPHDRNCPLVCVDESSKQLIKETRTPLAMKSGQPARYDYEYERNGTANLFMMFAPLEGWRHVKVTDRHTAVDYAQVLKELSDIRFPDAEKIILVQDNLNTHTPASLYEAFPAEEARRLVERFEWHYTPKHGCPCRIFKLERTDGEAHPRLARRARVLPSGRRAESARPSSAIDACELSKWRRCCSPKITT